MYGQQGQMTISYGQITSVLTKAMQEQQQIITKQQQDLENLKAEASKSQDANKKIEALQKENAEFKKKFAEFENTLDQIQQKKVSAEKK